MTPDILRSPRARLDLLEIWTFVAADDPAAADRLLDRFDEVLARLARKPLMARARPELEVDLRSFPVGNYVVFIRPLADGILVVRILSRHLDIAPEDFA